jgi:hypothetical protein
MNQQSMGAMLGVRRESVTATAGKFQAADLIGYRRGRMSVLDKRGLEQRSCECYRFIRQQYESLYGEMPRLLSPV